MNIDFHYYATYVAATLAGYNKQESECIAYAAQYVDDSTHSQTVLMNSKGYPFAPTVHTLSEITGKITVGTPDFYDEVKRVWPVFHFLPGNFDNAGNLFWPYEGCIEDSGRIAIWKYDEDAQQQFKLICRAQSPLAKSMIDDLVRRSNAVSLEEIGLRMHVLADTWAHMYFSGIPSWFMNTIEKQQTQASLLDVDEEDQYREIKEITKALEAEQYGEDSGAKLLGLSSSYYNSYVYLGHCQAGHNPDYPYLQYRLKPQWKSSFINKNNPADFISAFKQMMIAMYCIKNKLRFSFNEQDFSGFLNTNNSAIDKVMSILETSKKDQCKTWKQKIPEIQTNYGIAIQCPVDYDGTLWKKRAEINGVDFQTTSYYQFNVAAVNHLQYVKRGLNNYNIYLDDIPVEQILVYKAKCMPVSRYISVRRGNTPSLSSDNGVALNFILPDKRHNMLRCGVPVKIRTSEPDSNQKVYLGAWSDSDISYDVLDYNIFRQKWVIEQEGKTYGDIITCGSHELFIKNVHANKYLTVKHNGELILTDSKNSWHLEA